MRLLNIDSPVLGRKEKESLIEKDWPCHHLCFIFSWTFMDCPLFFFLTLFWTREYVKNSILLNLLDLDVFTHCRLD